MAHESDLYDFTVEEHAEGPARMRKLIGRSIVVAIPVAFVIVMLSLNLAMIAILAVTYLPVALAFWKWFNLEFKYELQSGTMSFYVIHGSKLVNKLSKPKPQLKVTIKEMLVIAPLDEEGKARIAAEGVKKTHNYTKSLTKGQDIYYGIFEQDGEKQVVYFEATAQALKILHYYNRNNTTVVPVFR
jgi:hypothetical protein